MGYSGSSGGQTAAMAVWTKDDGKEAAWLHDRRHSRFYVFLAQKLQQVVVRQQGQVAVLEVQARVEQGQAVLEWEQVLVAVQLLPVKLRKH